MVAILLRCKHACQAFRLLPANMSYTLHTWNLKYQICAFMSDPAVEQTKYHTKRDSLEIILAYNVTCFLYSIKLVLKVFYKEGKNFSKSCI